jgi:hypothetical protein
MRIFVPVRFLAVAADCFSRLGLRIELLESTPKLYMTEKEESI